MARKACKDCRRIVTGNVCPKCKTSNTTTSFQGVVVIFDTESEVAKKLKIDEPGKYAIKV